MQSSAQQDKGRLTTHVLDIARGRPAENLAITLYRLDGERRKVTEAVTNADGRCDSPLLEGGALETGRYELVFDVAPYFDALGLDLRDPKFLDEVVVRFGVAEERSHIHVPLLLAPHGYSTYRGS